MSSSPNSGRDGANPLDLVWGIPALVILVIVFGFTVALMVRSGCAEPKPAPTNRHR